MSLSAVISAYNEEKKIEDCLKSVSFADEIILVNNSSTDRTAEIAKKYTSKIFKRANNPMLNVNKNFGFSKATGDWILNLDADERVSEELQKEIKQVLKTSKDVNGYWIPRKNIIFGKWIEYTGWYPDHQLRLFRKNKGKFGEKHIHEMIKLNGKDGYLNNNLTHYNYENIIQFLHKMEIYVESESKNLIENGYELQVKDVINLPLKEFMSRFFAREGYKDGLHGLVLSFLMSFYYLCIFVSIWEKQKFKDQEINSFSLIEEESRNIGKEFKYWFKNEKIKLTKNPLKKIWLKIK